MTDKTFATAINCMDGRVQIPVIEWLKRQCGVDYVDMITEPGPERLLAEAKDLTACASIRRRLEISVNRHNSNLVAIAGHHDCAGNPADKETQLVQILTAIKTVEAWNFKVRVIGLWVNENWEVHERNRRNKKEGRDLEKANFENQSKKFETREKREGEGYL